MLEKSGSELIFKIDLLILSTCFLSVFIHYQGVVSIPFKGLLLMVCISFLWFIVAYSSSLVNVNIESRPIDILKTVLIGYSVLCVSVIFVVAVFSDFEPNHKLILWSLFLGWIFSSLFRMIYLIMLRYLVRKGYNQKSVILIGGGRVVEKVLKKVLSSHNMGYRLYGILADNYHESLPKQYYLGKLDRFSEVVRPAHIDEVIIALPLRMEKEIIEMVEKCEYEGIRVRVVPDFFRIIRNRAVWSSLGDIPLIGIRVEPLSLLRNRALKRLFDIAFSLAVLITLSPMFLIVAIVIKITSKGPVFFKQERVGINNVKFEMYKFRSMTIQPKNDSDTLWTTSNDGRITPFGKFMRKTNIDEFPQFWNVLKGDMSVVGPRPEREYFVEQFKEQIPSYKVRHLAKSGITGWAQVNGWRGDTSIKSRVEYDIYYIENWSFWLDIKIIWLTVFGKKTNQNAY